jgi:two-component system, sensor histidine kinase RegB
VIVNPTQAMSGPSSPTASSPTASSDERRAILGDGGLRLQTSVRLRWFAVAGQLLAVMLVHFGMGFPVPLSACIGAIALSTWVNIFLRLAYPTPFRLPTRMATALLAYDALQLAVLLYLTGGIENPFVFLLVAPVTVSAATLPPFSTLALGTLAGSAALVLTQVHLPLPWNAGVPFALPLVYRWGVVVSVLASMVFLALYVFRLSKESRQMSAALAATESILAREQQLHALDGLAAAAAHELGTPLATITVIAKELGRSVPADSSMAEDFALLQSQAVRCREILQKLTRSPSEKDPFHGHVTVMQMIEEAALPYLNLKSRVVILSMPPDGQDAGDFAGLSDPLGERRPGVIYGIGNLIENAIDFAKSEVRVTGRWNAREVVVTISDDGPGFRPEVMDTLGDPFVTTRSSRSRAAKEAGASAGLGLGFFIAKTLLERSGARLALDNREKPETGAVVTIVWPRQAFEAPATGWRIRQSGTALPKGLPPPH